MTILLDMLNIEVTNIVTIGERLKRLRVERGMTQKEVGKILGITKGAVQKYESGQITNFRTETIKQLSVLFGIAPAYFIFEDVEEDYSSANSENLRNMIILHFGERFVKFLDVLDTLNEDGRAKVIEYTNDLHEIEKYRRNRYKQKKEPLR